MTSVPNRILRRLDDRRVVFRLHPRAKAVVLTDDECARVQRMSKWSTLLQVFLTLAMALSALLAYASPPLRTMAGAVAIFLLFAVILIERGYARAMASILDRAPVSAVDNMSPLPSWGELAAMHFKLLLGAISDWKLRNFLVVLPLVFLAAVWQVLANVIGIQDAGLKMSMRELMLVLLCCPLLFMVLFAERRRRLAEKQTAEKTEP
ncbi:hypothetical protein GB928_007805 [Shinella curvata]|uniref:Uncharacterized protein n=1 Tax=Shinella curvata TaxID=1817964 RepID=A0ABT8XCU7_9HYPH|nr:hypothetical protein [Shinella curvata]MCJ8054064.1 hypothetical protein [Shinella curvata]MDO6121086.1 hypothetical protein [Shinella curvata]